MILWTDASLRAFIAEHAQPFLPIFDGFPRGVCRADLGRYLLLQHFGGIYADLDCQCLQPLRPLLEGRELVLALEPEEHARSHNAMQQGLGRIPCPSFLASAQGHQLWQEVLESILNVKAEQVLTDLDVLEATGPFLLARIFTRNTIYERFLVSSSYCYPFTKDECWKGQVFDLQFWSERCLPAYIAHHWDSSWLHPSRGSHAGVPRQAPVSVQEPPTRQAPHRNAISPNPLAETPITKVAQPLISCLMATRGQPQLAMLAISTFLQQTYPERELVVADGNPDSRLSDWILDLANPLIQLVRPAKQGLSLSDLLKTAAERARGTYLCQWNDKDMHDPVRLEVQVRTLLATSSDASILARRMVWWPSSQRLVLSRYQDWEGSLLCQRSFLPQHSELFQSGEDTEVLTRLRSNARLARIDMPRRAGRAANSIVCCRSLGVACR